MTVSLLIQIDKLVQLLESTVFTCGFFLVLLKRKVIYAFLTALRLQLLEPEKHPYLHKALYGILMLLPQSTAFVTLRNRLNSVSALGYLHIVPKTAPSYVPLKFALVLARAKLIQNSCTFNFTFYHAQARRHQVVRLIEPLSQHSDAP